MRKFVGLASTYGLAGLFIVGVFVSIGSQDASALDAENVVAAWLFDGGTGEDSSANANDAQIKGQPKLVGGKFGKALEFNGIDTYLEVPDNDTLNPGSITVAAWVNLNAIGPKHYRIISKDTQPDAGPNREYQIMVRSNDLVEWEVWTGATLDTVAGARAVTEVPTKEWHHIAGTYDGTTINTYFDGVMEGSAPHPKKGPLWNGEAPLQIGAHPGYGEFANAIIDEVAIFNVALTEAEINTVMNHGLAAILAGQEVAPSGKISTAWGSIKGGYSE